MVDVSNPWTVVFFVFQAVFVGTAATIDSGAIAGRTKFATYLIMSAIISTVIYPVFGHWAWGGLLHDQAGWLEMMGFKDFAGSTVVHSVGGWMALVGIIVLGPRIEKYGKDGSINKIAPHNMALAYLGTFILFFGWFGFNCGSTLEAGPDIAGIAINTMLAACFGCIASSTLSWILTPMKRPEGEMIANGMLAGLVGITAGCAFVDTMGAMFIGLTSGIVVYWSTLFIERVLKLDDVVGAVAVHGFCGAWGTIALGFFILPEHLGEMSRMQQIWVQTLGVGACFAWTFGVGYLVMKGLDFFFGMRVSREDELLGLNIAEHGASSSVLDLVHAMNDATRTGNFADSMKLDVEIGTEMGDLSHGFNQMIDAIKGALIETKKQVKVAEKAKSDAEESHFQLETSKKEYKNFVDNIAEKLTTMMKETEEAMSMISATSSVLKGDVTTVRNHSKEINNAIASINKLTLSSRLLALNAQVEAARAGEQGVGFAVVAQQMGIFSNQTEEATNLIASITEKIQHSLEKVYLGTESQGKALVDGSQKVSGAIKLVHSILETDITGLETDPLVPAHNA